jgi:hypothetical protein
MVIVVLMKIKKIIIIIYKYKIKWLIDSNKIIRDQFKYINNRLDLKDI